MENILYIEEVNIYRNLVIILAIIIILLFVANSKISRIFLSYSPPNMGNNLHYKIPLHILEISHTIS